MVTFVTNVSQSAAAAVLVGCKLRYCGQYLGLLVMADPMVEIMARLTAMVAELKSVKSKEAEMEQDYQWGNDSGEEGEQRPGEPSWAEFLTSPLTQPTSDDAVLLCKLLASPPPLDQVKLTEQQVTRYQHVPQTPPPRKNRIENQLYIAQTKMENTLHLLVNYM